MPASDPPFDFTPAGKPLDPPSGDPVLIEEVPRHFEEIFGEVAVVYHEKASEFIHLDVFQFDPEPGVKSAYTLVTGGLAAKPMNTPSEIQNRENYLYAELVLHLPEDWPMQWDELQRPENFWPIAALKSFARLPHERESWIWGGHTLRNGELEPYAADTELCAALLCPSFQLPPKFETLGLSDGREIVFLSLAFLYREEWEFTSKHQSEALFERAKKFGLRPMHFFVLDKSRPNLCR